MARKQGFSGIRPPSDGGIPPSPKKRERLVRMSPPANDNRGKGISLGRLRFTGVRILAGLLLGAAIVLVALGLGLI